MTIPDERKVHVHLFSAHVRPLLSNQRIAILFLCMPLCPKCSAQLDWVDRCPNCALEAVTKVEGRKAFAPDGWTMLGLLLVFPGLTCFFTAWPTRPTGGSGRVHSAIDWNGTPDRFLLTVGILSLAGFAVGLLRLAWQRRYQNR